MLRAVSGYFGWVLNYTVIFYLYCMSVIAVAEESRIPVTVKTFAEVVIYPQESAPATVVSLNDSRLSAEIRGRVVNMVAKVGDVVEHDQILVELDCREHRLGLQQAEATLTSMMARLNLTKEQLNRAQSLNSSANISQEVLQQRRAELDVAAAELAEAQTLRERAELDVERCIVRAPFEGVVLERLLHVGELADVGTPLLHLLDLQRLEISAQVLSDQVKGITLKTNVRFIGDGQVHPVKLRTLIPALNAQSRNREARLQFKTSRALPGTAGRVVWDKTVSHLPAELVVRRDGRLGVFVTKDDSVRFVVLPLALEGRPVEVELALDSLIVIDGRQMLRDGDGVNAKHE